MSKEAFIRRLRELLAGLPQSEAAEAIQYYEDYFADAGEENEAKVIEELGSPEKVAANIRADLGMAGTQEEGGAAGGQNGGYEGGYSTAGTNGGGYGDTGTDGGSIRSGYSAGTGSSTGGGYGDARYSDSRYEEPSKGKHTGLWVALAICTCYVWIPLILVAVILVFVAVVVVCALSFAFGVTAFALGVTGIALVGVAIAKMFLSPAAGLLLLGGGLVLAGVTIFCIILVGMLFGKAIPSFFRWVGSLGRRARRRGGNRR